MILRRIFCVLLALVLAAGFVALYAFKVEPALLFVRSVELAYESLPEQWDGRTIVFFSDVHIGPGYPPERLERVVSAINEADPDLVLFGGDLVDSETPTDAAYRDRVGAILARIKAPSGKLAIAGNHDNRLRAELTLARRMLEAGGFTLLINQAREIDGLVVGGLDESYFGKPDFQKTFQAFPENLFRLVLMHQPDYLPGQSGHDYDLALSGHAHNGQVTFFGKPILTVYSGSEYTYGTYDLGNEHPGKEKRLHVTAGLGTVGIHARFFAPPEIVVIKLVRTAS
jgi:predicted MPP superfamily phosphohydrolase